MKVARKDLLDKISYLKQEDLDNRVTLQKLKRLYAFKEHDSLYYRFYLTLNKNILPDERVYYEEVIKRLDDEEQVKISKYLDKVLSP